jgi:hypothetical protein
VPERRVTYWQDPQEAARQDANRSQTHSQAVLWIIIVLLALTGWAAANNNDQPVELEHPPTCNRMVCD